MSVTVFGIANCDSVKKVRTFLAERGISYTFHDYKKQGVPETQLREWVSAKGWEVLLKRNGTTWRSLDENIKAAVVNAEAAIALMMSNPSTIKRPVVVSGETTVVGVDFDRMAKLSRPE